MTENLPPGMSSGWGDSFLGLAQRFDAALARFRNSHE